MKILNESLFNSQRFHIKFLHQTVFKFIKCNTQIGIRSELLSKQQEFNNGEVKFTLSLVFLKFSTTNEKDQIVELLSNLKSTNVIATLLSRGSPNNRTFRAKRIAVFKMTIARNQRTTSHQCFNESNIQVDSRTSLLENNPSLG